MYKINTVGDVFLCNLCGRRKPDTIMIYCGNISFQFLAFWYKPHLFKGVSKKNIWKFANNNNIY
jgi:hypothetical protein